MRPSRPVPVTSVWLRLFSANNFRTTGESFIERSRSGRSATGTGVAAGSAFGASGSNASGESAAASPVPSITASLVPTATVSPSATNISVSTPSAIAGTSISTLSVPISNKISLELTVSPTFLCQTVSVPSATVSPICGMITSINRPPAARFQKYDQPTGSSRPPAHLLKIVEYAAS